MVNLFGQLFTETTGRLDLLSRKRTVSRNIIVEEYFKNNPSLKELMIEMSKISHSTGVSDLDYIVLYDFVKKKRPQYILECGTGISTFIIAQSIKDNLITSEKGCKLVSMESEKHYYDHQMDIFPKEFNDFVEIIYSPIKLYGYSFIRGTTYQDVPEYPYELVFVDGPNQVMREKGRMCNMDFVKILENSDNPISCVIDSRVHTVLAYTQIFGERKVKWYPKWNLTIINDVVKDDMILSNGLGDSSDKKRIKKKLLKPRSELENPLL